MKHRTPAYWPTRILLSIPFVSLVMAALLFITAPTSMFEPVSGPPPFALIIGAVLWLIGTVWMVRIFRGPGDEPPGWRYRR